MYTKYLTILQRETNVKPFTFEITKSVAKNLVFKDGVVFHPIFWKIKMPKGMKNTLMELAEMIDPSTGILSEEFSGGQIVPLTERQISVKLEKDVKDAIKFLVAYGVLAEVRISRNKIYIANPFVVTKGLTCNGFLLKLFCKRTLQRFDEFNEYFSVANEAEFSKFWERLEEIE